MTVQEFIEILSKMPPDAIVQVVRRDDYGGSWEEDLCERDVQHKKSTNSIDGFFEPDTVEIQ